KTAAKLGKGLGAKVVLLGSFFVREDKMRMDARLVHIETGSVLFSHEMAGSRDDFMDLEKQLAKKIIDAFGVKLSKVESLDMSVVPTKNVRAAAAYGRAIVMSDDGDLMKAQLEVQKALKADPKYKAAGRLLKDIRETLSKLDKDAFRGHVNRLAKFEMALPDWPCQPRDPRMYEYLCLKFEPAHYKKLYDQGAFNQALSYWFSRMLPYAPFGLPGKAKPDAFCCLFEGAAVTERCSKTPVGGTYRILGGHEVMKFWCEIFSSDPSMVPKEKVTSKMVNPNGMRSTGAQRLRARWVQRYGFVLATSAATAVGRGEWSKCAILSKRGVELYGDLPIGGYFTGSLRALEEVLGSEEALADQWSCVRKDMRTWRLAERRLVARMMEIQRDRFSVGSGKIDQKLALKAVIREYKDFLATYSTRTSPQTRTQEYFKRKAEIASTEALLLAGDGAFVARKYSSGWEAAFVLFHVAGCPWSLPASRGRLAPKSSVVKYDSPEKAMAAGHLPCRYCLPARWLARSGNGSSLLLGKILAETAERIVGVPKPGDAERAENLLHAVITNGDKNALQAVRKILQAARGEKAGKARRVVKTALTALGTVGNHEDVPVIARYLSDSPFWDVRCYAAAALGQLGGKESLRALTSAEPKEPYYFVRHWIQAARLRLQADAEGGSPRK
ncbi:MAG: HEAT repeat domain-containing protein, partial [Kiritimatiellia bacterium]|nr:HEAT repeat domain-containing protein [Kiritimatiellia bacterium]